MVYSSSFILVLISFVFFVYLLITKKIGVFFTQWVIYVIWFFSFPAFLQYVNHVYPWANFPNDSEVIEANIVTIVFTLFLFFGYSLGFVKRREVIIEDKVFYIGPLTNSLAILMLMPAIIFIQITGVAAFFSGRSSLGEMVYADSFMPMLYALSKFTAFGVLIVYISICRYGESKGRTSTASKFILFLAALINFVINNPLSSPRFHFLSMAIALIILFGFMNSRKTLIMLFFMSPFLLFVVFPQVKHLGDTSQDYKTYDTASYVVQGIDFDSFQQLVNIIRFVGDQGYSFGLNFIAGICFFVPRFLWESKPTNLGILAAEHQGYFYTNLSAPLVGELYYAGNFIFIIIGSLIIGYFTGKADSYLQSKRISNLYFIGLWFSSFAFILFRGSFGSVAPPIILGLCSSLLLFLSVKKKEILS
ncbi:hypothetical protein PUG81_24690 [Erwiniaceae bacterium L1_54_6]|nr:hypothetical protein [Erwiniaceae bacterium L1_54_6]